MQCNVPFPVPRMTTTLHGCLLVLEQAREANLIAGKDVDEAIEAARALLVLDDQQRPGDNDGDSGAS